MSIANSKQVSFYSVYRMWS